MIGDVLLLARHLKALPPQDRPQKATDCLEKAHVADKWRKKTSKPHPIFGDGSVMGQVMGLDTVRGPLPDLTKNEDCSCLIVALTAIERWRHRTK